MTIKEFFKKYATVSNIVKVWNAGITKEKVDEVVSKLFIKADKDGNQSIQVKDLILEIIEKIKKQAMLNEFIGILVGFNK